MRLGAVQVEARHYNMRGKGEGHCRHEGGERGKYGGWAFAWRSCNFENSYFETITKEEKRGSVKKMPIAMRRSVAREHSVLGVFVGVDDLAGRQGVGKGGVHEHGCANTEHQAKEKGRDNTVQAELDASRRSVRCRGNGRPLLSGSGQSSQG